MTTIAMTSHNRKCGSIAVWRKFLLITIASGAVCLFPVSGQHTEVQRTRSARQKDYEEICQTEGFRANCQGENEVVVMTTAFYGRMRLQSRCIERNYGYIGCSNDVIGSADVMCSGRRSCHVFVPNGDFEAQGAATCPRDFKMYLEASYRCQTVVTGDPSMSCQPNVLYRLTAREGHIASSVSDATGRGTAQCPWLIQGRRGQRINITLWDFGAERHRANTAAAGPGGLVGPDTCHAYSVIRERSPARSVTICSEGKRTLGVYSSSSESVEIRILSSGLDKEHLQRSRHFILQYEKGAADRKELKYKSLFQAHTFIPMAFETLGPITSKGKDFFTDLRRRISAFYGCPEIDKKDDDQWHRLHGNRMEVGCSGSGATWWLDCNGFEWVGPSINCSSSEAALIEMKLSKNQIPSATTSLLAMTIIAIVLSVVIVISGLFIIACRRRRVSGRGQPNVDADPREIYYRHSIKSVSAPIGTLDHCNSPRLQPRQFYNGTTTISYPQLVHQQLENEYSYIADLQHTPSTPTSGSHVMSSTSGWRNDQTHVTGAGSTTSRPVIVGGAVQMPRVPQRFAVKGAVDNYHPRSELNYDVNYDVSYDVDDSSTMAIRGINSMNATVTSYSGGGDADTYHA